MYENGIPAMVSIFMTGLLIIAGNEDSMLKSDALTY